MDYPTTTIYKDDNGETVVVDACPARGITEAHVELITQAGIFVDTNIAPATGGQEEQPLWFFEAVGAVKSYLQQKQRYEEQKNAPT